MAQLISTRWEPARVDGYTRAQRTPCRYEAYLPDPLALIEVDIPGGVAAAVSDAESAILRLNAERTPHVGLEAVARLLLRAEAVASSRIEGLEVGPRRLVRVEAARLAGHPRADVTAEAVLGNVEAMRYAVDELVDRPRLALGDILALHAALMRHTPHPELGGQLRPTQNWIGGNSYNPCGAAYVPPPPDAVPDLMDDLVAFMNTDRYPPVVQAALVHAQFETIHPFADGNGRTGRALIHVVLGRRGLAPRYVPPISLVLATRSPEYIGGLVAYRYVGAADSPAARASIARWLAVFADAAVVAATEAVRFSAQIDALVERWRGLARPRAGSTADLLLRVLPAAPVIMVATAARLVGRSVRAANTAVEQLATAGVLKPVNTARWGRAFEADGVIDALIGFERQLASPDADTRPSPPVRPVPHWPNHV